MVGALNRHRYNQINLPHNINLTFYKRPFVCLIHYSDFGDSLEHKYLMFLKVVFDKMWTLLTCGSHKNFKNQSPKSPNKDRSLGSFCTVCGPHRHVAARDWFIFKFKKKKKFLTTPFGVLPIIMVLISYVLEIVDQCELVL